VVLAIVGVLALASISTLGPKSPKATRAILLDLRNAIQNARQTAVSSGKTVRIRLENISGQWQFKAMDSALVETDVTATLFSDALPLKPLTYCSLAAAFQDLPATSTVVTSLPPANSYGFGTSALPKAWTQCLTGASQYGFSSAGTTIQLTGASPNPTVSVANGGFWVGVVGTTPNAKGVPYGVVLVTEQGQIVTYYKGDSQLDDTPENKWKRLE
jgi:type II secretory pathway pseudopilin PulG